MYEFVNVDRVKDNYFHVTFLGFMDIMSMSQDTISFHQLYHKYSKDVFRFSFWLTGDAAEAKDITSETFVRVWTAKTETCVESVKAYLFTITRNLNLQNKCKKKRLAPLEEEMRDTTIQPDEIAEIRSDLAETLKALQLLPDIDRAVLIMRAEDELSYEEIARSTGLSISGNAARTPNCW
jgi:RNA polymerase sigma-70 factor, ECF subfamily